VTRLFDLGAQLERTTLAWLRTALALTAAGALVARFAVISGLPLLGYAVGAALVATGIFSGALASRSYARRHARLDSGDGPGSPPLPLACVSAALGLAAAAALIIVVI
jgi:uncharacterized membrane protein YidH (DUF202 family)